MVVKPGIASNMHFSQLLFQCQDSFHDLSIHLSYTSYTKTTANNCQLFLLGVFYQTFFLLRKREKVRFKSDR